ncbi:hypothetical protein DUI87_21807 [Hirundo rustica rustica]|uniref:Uncharacterized protein n=1 Tax=Hirundo rustica rustica TaxID=333673 RepID=A0A3M0JKK9_HIRRU|nr:hypothetical protein DUI87_21807 [Hirundo rustica rustica]
MSEHFTARVGTELMALRVRSSARSQRRLLMFKVSIFLLMVALGMSLNRSLSTWARANIWVPSICLRWEQPRIGMFQDPREEFLARIFLGNELGQKTWKCLDGNIGILGYWDIGILEYWTIGIMGYWDMEIGILEYWNIGILEYWNIGYWKLGIMGYWDIQISQHLNIPITGYGNIGISEYPNIPIFEYLNIPIPEYGNIGIFNIPIFEYLNI